MGCSMPGFPVLHHLLELTQTMSIESLMPSNHLILCRPLSSCLQSFPALGSFLTSQLFSLGGQSIGVSASPSILLMNIQGWFPLGLTGLIFLLSRRLSRVFSSTTIWKHQFFGTQPSLWKNYSFKITADGDCSHEIKRCLLLGRKAMTNLDSILKSRDIFANKSLSSQSYGFSSTLVWMWELDHKEGWALKNWYFWTVVLEKTLESPLDFRETKPVNLKGNQPWIFIRRTDAEAEAPVL